MPPPAPLARPRAYTVAVRALCEFTAKQGDLDLRFTPAPTAQEGIAGHALVASRRGPSYQTEVSLSGSHHHLQVRGRADGYDATRQRLEEIKTHRGRSAQAIPEHHRLLHWAQLKCYGALLCKERALESVELALVYLDVTSSHETVLAERWSAQDLQAFFEAQCERFLDWADRELQHRAARDEALAGLSFPHEAFRDGQRMLAEAVYRAAASGRCLMAQAPTGIGKTVGTIFPMLKAAPLHALDKVFFLSAKTSGRAVALRALDRIQSGGREACTTAVRTLEMVARDKACEHPDLACHGDSCPLAKGFYDRLPEARRAAVSCGQALDQATVRDIALAHSICPYYLSQEMVRWSDVVVGDYNYYFDQGALLHGLALAHEWQVGVLVDEAHNLVDRGRRMYSAEMSQGSLRAAARNAPAAVHAPLDRLLKQWSALNKTLDTDYTVLDEWPAGFQGALQRASAALTEYWMDHPTHVDAELQAWHFEALNFLRLSEQAGTHSLLDVQRHAPGAGAARKPSSTVCVRNVVPAPFLGPRFRAARSVTLFSATLEPQAYYRNLLGLPDDTAAVDVPSPFRSEQLHVQVARHISTRYTHRQSSAPAIADLMAREFEDRPGNYLAFFSSHDYLQDVAALFESRHPNIPVWKQQRGMAEAAQAEFLARFTPESQGIGFAVLGGSFAEGVDLPGRRLVGAFIATLGLPQVNPINEQVRLRLDALLGAGHDYTYLYPGLQKVVQAAGRVIRTAEDTGVVHLLDDRYGRREVRALLPQWWAVCG